MRVLARGHGAVAERRIDEARVPAHLGDATGRRRAHTDCLSRADPEVDLIGVSPGEPASAGPPPRARSPRASHRPRAPCTAQRRVSLPRRGPGPPPAPTPPSSRCRRRSPPPTRARHARRFWAEPRSSHTPGRLQPTPPSSPTSSSCSSSCPPAITHSATCVPPTEARQSAAIADGDRRLNNLSSAGRTDCPLHRHFAFCCPPTVPQPSRAKRARVQHATSAAMAWCWSSTTNRPCEHWRRISSQFLNDSAGRPRRRSSRRARHHRDQDTQLRDFIGSQERRATRIDRRPQWVARDSAA